MCPLQIIINNFGCCIWHFEFFLLSLHYVFAVRTYYLSRAAASKEVAAADVGGTRVQIKPL